jgi:hypothetical protein
MQDNQKNRNTDRSNQYAEDLMKAVSMDISVITAFRQGRILKSGSLLNGDYEELNDEDLKVVEQLKGWNNRVYHVIKSTMNIAGIRSVINGVESFESTGVHFWESTSYLCVPIDFAKEFGVDDEEIIQESIDHYLKMAKKGYLFSYTVVDGVGNMGDIVVTSENGKLKRIG